MLVREEEPQQLTFFDLPQEEQEGSVHSKEQQEVLQDLDDADVLNMTPLQALQYVFELKEKLISGKG